MRYLFSILFILSAGFVSAQETDSLFVVKKEGNWEIKYTAKARETAKMLCKRFHVDESQMEYANDEGTMKKMTEGQTVHIPLGKNNFVVTKPVKLNATRNLHELYYKVVARDEIAMLSTYSGVTKSELREWNALKGNTLRPGQILFIGWVKMVMKDSTDPATYAAWPAPPKKPVVLDTTGNMPVPGGLDTIYNRQTNNGLNVLTEKGTAVFFEKPGRNNMYYAFHNEAARGSIIRVHNPGTGKTTYVKVLGPLPDTKLYANCVIGISDGAREALGIVNDNKAWCELSYAAN
jgi:LysM repeat protein